MNLLQHTQASAIGLFASLGFVRSTLHKQLVCLPDSFRNKEAAMQGVLLLLSAGYWCVFSWRFKYAQWWSAQHCCMQCAKQPGHAACKSRLLRKSLL